MKHHRRRLLLPILLLPILFFTLPETAHACLCAPATPLTGSAASTVVFRGQVTQVGDPEFLQNGMTIDIKEIWKGASSAKTLVRKEIGIACSNTRRFRVGEEYLFYLSPTPNDTFTLRDCHRVMPMDQTLPDRLYLLAIGALPGTPLAATPLHALTTTRTPISVALALIPLNLLLTISILVAIRFAIRLAFTRLLQRRRAQ